MREAHYNAFPSPDSDGKCNPDECGLTKLEYFAGMAMQGMLSNPRFADESSDNIINASVDYAKWIIQELEAEQ